VSRRLVATTEGSTGSEGLAGGARARASRTRARTTEAGIDSRSRMPRLARRRRHA
jgi:hypothetical protein